MDIGKIVARGLIQLGAGGPNLRNNGGVIEARNPGNTALSSLAVSDITLLQKKVTISPSVPTSPNIGDLWFELNNTNQAQKYGWPWSWSGGYWLSPQHRQKMHAIGANSVDNVYYLHLEQSLDTYIEALETCSLVAPTNNGTNYWTFTLSHVIANNTASIITTLTTASNPASNWVVNRADLSQHLDISALGARILQLFAAKTNAPGPCYLTPEITYRYARP